MKSTVHVLEGQLAEGRAWKHKRAEEVGRWGLCGGGEGHTFFMKQIIKRTKDKNEQ